MIRENDIMLAQYALGVAAEEGAAKARVTLCRSREDMVSTLDGEVDRITHCEDASMDIALFVDGRYGCFSTNKLSRESIKEFIRMSVPIVRMLAPDPCRDLPAPERCCKDASSGNELGLLDSAYASLTPEDRIRLALSACGSDPAIISEEGEWSDSVYDTLVMDSNGTRCLHSENNFDFYCEVTVEGEDGEKYSGSWWDSSCRLSEVDVRECGRKALEYALGQVGSDTAGNRRCAMVVDTEVASKMVSPILRALGGYSLQQGESFLRDSLGKKLFPEGMNLYDCPHIKGQVCSKLFDSEGVATMPAPIIEAGIVKRYFLNTYMAAKMGMEPTVEDPVRPVLRGWPVEGLDRTAILARLGEGILVTDFNGGNFNPVTGDFSYGIEGFEFSGGKCVKPVSGMLVTGNYLTLWGNLLFCGSDARNCMSKLIPTLAFANVDFNG